MSTLTNNIKKLVFKDASILEVVVDKFTDIIPRVQLKDSSENMFPNKKN